jgi:hypothetical protein
MKMVDDELNLVNTGRQDGYRRGNAPKPIAPYHQQVSWKTWEGAAMFDTEDKPSGNTPTGTRTNVKRSTRILEASTTRRRPPVGNRKSSLGSIARETDAQIAKKEKWPTICYSRPYAQQPLPPDEQGEGVEAIYPKSQSVHSGVVGNKIRRRYSSIGKQCDELITENHPSNMEPTTTG